MLNIIVPVIVMIIFMALIMVFILSRYKKCPPDKIMVVYGNLGKDPKTGEQRTSLSFHGGSRLILPIVQRYAFIDIKPIKSEIVLKESILASGDYVDITGTFTYAVSTFPVLIDRAGQRLLGLSTERIKDLCEDIIKGQQRYILSISRIEEIMLQRDKFCDMLAAYIETELNKLGINLVGLEVHSIKDSENSTLLTYMTQVAKENEHVNKSGHTKTLDNKKDKNDKVENVFKENEPIKDNDVAYKEVASTEIISDDRFSRIHDKNRKSD